MKSAAAFLIFILSITAGAFGQSDVGINAPDYTKSNTGLGTTSKSASGSAPSTTPDESKSVEGGDDNLYRGKTTESQNPMLRDEGPIHFKTRPKEKIQEIDSKKLSSTRTDPKFQGAFATSGVNSIEDIAAKSTETRAEAMAREVAPENQGDPRFVRRHLTFAPQTDEKATKAEAESSPSPTPSPTASPAKNSSNSKP
jgi:hypothetical protein